MARISSVVFCLPLVCGGIAGAQERAAEPAPAAEAAEAKRDAGRAERQAQLQEAERELADWEIRVRRLASALQAEPELADQQQFAAISDAWQDANEAFAELEEEPPLQWDRVWDELQEALQQLEQSWEQAEAERLVEQA